MKLRMTHARFRTLAWTALAFALAVILWGAFVRASGSGAGCGSHWPTCNGEVIPHPKSIQTIIEFTHRATSGISFLLVLAQFVWAFVAFPRRHPIRIGAAFSMFFMVTEAAVGAGLVLFELVAENKSIARAEFMAVHLINTFLLVASMSLTAFWASGGPVPRRGGGGEGAGLLAGLLGVGMFGTLLVGVTGAVAALGDTLFPARTLGEGLAQDLSPTAHFLVQLRVLHPVVAAVTTAYVLFVTGLVGAKRPALRPWAARVGVLVGLQIGAGFLNLLLLAPVWMQIVHLLMADVVWIGLVLLGSATLGELPAPAEPSPRAVPQGA
jgi:heme A synthase